MWQGLALWLIIMALETVHGVLRGLLLVPLVGEALASWIGLMVGSAIVLFVATLLIHLTGLRYANGLLKLGAVWAVLTLVFEIGVGLLRGFDATRIWAEINPLSGGTMLVSLAIMFLAPLVATWLRGLLAHA